MAKHLFARYNIVVDKDAVVEQVLEELNRSLNLSKYPEVYKDVRDKLSFMLDLPYYTDWAVGYCRGIGGFLGYEGPLEYCIENALKERLYNEILSYVLSKLKRLPPAEEVIARAQEVAREAVR
jgi:hypothetical protein